MTYVNVNGKPFEKTVNSLFNDIFSGLPSVLTDEFSNLTKKSFVPVNIKETEKSYLVEVIAPGFEKTDFNVKLDGNLLTITAERKKDEKKEIEKQVRREYSYQSINRSFTIDEKVDATAIEASYVNGVLILNLPKKAEVKEESKEIKIN